MFLSALLTLFIIFEETAASFICVEGGGCEERCLEDCVGKCHLDLFVQYSPCSYGCIVDGISKFYTEPDFTYCGTNKVCYQGQCRAVSFEQMCKELYGEDYIGLQDLYNSCNIHCMSTVNSCRDIYDMDIPEGRLCFVGTSSFLGKCKGCRCVTNNETEIAPRNVPTNTDFAQTPKGFVSFGQAVAQSTGIEEFQIFGPVSNFISVSPSQRQGYLFPKISLKTSKHSGAFSAVDDKTSSKGTVKGANFPRRHSAEKHALSGRYKKTSPEEDYEANHHPRRDYDFWEE